MHNKNLQMILHELLYSPIINKVAILLQESIKIKLYVLIFLQSVMCNDRIERKTQNLIFQVKQP